MIRNQFGRHVAILAFGALAWLAAGPVDAAAPAKPDADAVSVEMFAAIKAGDIEVKMIPKDTTESTVLITNKSGKPLSIKLPEAFAGVPVLAQMLGGGLGAGGIGGGGNQGVGGGFGGAGGAGGGLGGGGFFNVAPDKVGKIKVTTVCLEHGKADPNPRIPYEIRPIESFTDKADVIEMCKMLARGEIDQGSAQAAAWHLANGLTWEQLAGKIGKRHFNGSTESFFTREQILRGMKIAAEAGHRAKEQKVVSPGDEDQNAAQSRPVQAPAKG
jgi:hypothetical protein